MWEMSVEVSSVTSIGLKGEKQMKILWCVGTIILGLFIAALGFYGGYVFRENRLPLMTGPHTVVRFHKGSDKWYEVGYVECMRDEDAGMAPE